VAFSVSEAPDAVSRVHVDLACNKQAPICSLDDQYVQYSAKRGLQRGLRTPQVFWLGKGVKNFLDSVVQALEFKLLALLLVSK